jgi:sensor domain CHASE-containing protein
MEVSSQVTFIPILVLLIIIIVSIGVLVLIAIIVARAVKGKNQRVDRGIYNKNENANQTKE